MTKMQILTENFHIIRSNFRAHLYAVHEQREEFLPLSLIELHSTNRNLRTAID